MQSNQQQWAHLLCRSCEALLSREGENWIFRHGMKQNGSFLLAELLRRSRPSVGTPGEHTRLYEAARIPEINATAITHFAIGIFWKASVYGWNTDGSIPVNLAGYDDQFRHFLLGEAEFPKDAVLAVLVREGGPIDRLTHTPARSAGPDISTYQFPIPGFSFVLTIGKNISERISQYCFVRGMGRPIVITVATEQFLFEQAQRAIERAQRPKLGPIGGFVSEDLHRPPFCTRARWGGAGKSMGLSGRQTFGVSVVSYSHSAAGYERHLLPASLLALPEVFRSDAPCCYGCERDSSHR